MAATSIFVENCLLSYEKMKKKTGVGRFISSFTIIVKRKVGWNVFQVTDRVNIMNP